MKDIAPDRTDQATATERRVANLSPIKAALYEAWIDSSCALLDGQPPYTPRQGSTATAQDQYPRDCSIDGLFEQVAHENSNIAIIEGEQTLTYEELNQAANQLAHYLLSEGLNLEDVVAVHLPRSRLVIIALLAILKAGGAYLPLNRRDPWPRTNAMLQNCSARWILTDQNSADVFSDVDGLRVVTLDPSAATWQSPQVANPAVEIGPTNLAYVMCTSGSTGRPKGVEVTHRSVIRLVRNANYAELSPAQTVLQLAPASFDASTFEIWGALLNGGRLVYCSEEFPDFDQLQRIIEDNDVNTLWLTATFFNSIVDHRPEILKPVRQLLTGGESLSAAHVRRAYSHLPRTTIVNGYGPTENTTFSTWFRIPRTVPDEWKSIPIGKPISGSTVYVLNEEGERTGAGKIGEIFVGGDGVARGYRNDEARTESCFLSDPFSPSPDARMYRTGDLATIGPGGDLEFQGRLDDQIKLRGFRIEPAEIESALNSFPDVAQSVVTLREDRPGEKRLVAYCVPLAQSELNLTDLNHHLQGRLPDYMIPALVLPIGKLPLLPSGKVDRQALPAPSDERPRLETAHETARNATEDQLVSIWQEVLGVRDVGVHDDFFDLGGHSLLAVQLVAAIEAEMGQTLPLNALFKLTTIADLATVLDGHESIIEPPTDIETASQPAPASRLDLVVSNSTLSSKAFRRLLTYTAGWKGQRATPDSLIFGMNTGGSLQPLYWCFQGFDEFKALAKKLGGDQPLYGMRSGHLVMDHTDENCRVLAAHYIADIRAVQPSGPYLLGGNCQAAAIALEIAKQLQEQNETVTLTCTLDTSTRGFYQGRIAAFYGHDSELNPYTKFHDPVLGWHKLYPGGYTLDVISGSHGQYFHSEKNIESFASRLQARIRETKSKQSAPFSPPAVRRDPFSDDIYHAQISATTSLSAKAGEGISIPVNVKNTSSCTWQPTAQSGITLANHWLDRTGRVVDWLDGVARLEDELPPRQETRIDLTVNLPRKPGAYVMRLDMVEQGVTWFAAQGSPVASIECKVARNGLFSRLLPGLAS